MCEIGEMMIEIKMLSDEIAQIYKEDLAMFYYQNIQACSCLDNFEYNDALNKINQLILHLKAGTAISYGVFDDIKLCGYIWAYEHDYREDHRVYISEIRIREEYRKHGYGKMLLDKVEEKARELKVKSLYIHAEANNDGAIKLYEREGFEIERVQMKKQLF